MHYSANNTILFRTCINQNQKNKNIAIQLRIPERCMAKINKNCMEKFLLLLSYSKTVRSLTKGFSIS